MGFSHFWSFLDSNGDKVKKEMLLDFRSKPIADRPWAVIDWNNLVMSLAVETGGHLHLIERRCIEFFNALVAGGVKICIVRDNSLHAEERSVIKLDRMHKDLLENTDVSGELLNKASSSIDSPDLVRSFAYTIALKVLKTHFAGRICSDIDDDNDETMFIDRRAAGEADPEIRIFARKQCRKGRLVLIVSHDSSLMLGVDPVQFLAYTKPSDLSVSHVPPLPVAGVDTTAKAPAETTETTDTPVATVQSFIKAQYYPIAQFLQALTTFSTDVLPRDCLIRQQRLVPLDTEMLPWVAALLGGEAAGFRSGSYDDPSILLRFVSTFIFPDTRNALPRPNNRRVFDLVVAVIIVRAWTTYCPRPHRDFLKCIRAIKECANAIRSSSQTQGYNNNSHHRSQQRQYQQTSSAPPLLFGLFRSWSSNCHGALKNAANNLLFKYNEVPLIHVRNAAAGGNVLVNYNGGGVWYEGRVTNRNAREGMVGVTFSAGFEARDGCPGGIANSGVCQAMAAEVTRREKDALDTDILTATHTRKTQWGEWTYLEPCEENTGMLLSPLISLVGQVDFFVNRVDRELYMASVEDNNMHLHQIELAGGNVEEAILSYNDYLRQLLSKVKPDEEEYAEGGFTELITRKILLPQGTGGAGTVANAATMPPVFTATQLIEQCIRQRAPLPLEGVLVSDLSTRTTTTTTSRPNSCGLMFLTSPMDDELAEDYIVPEYAPMYMTPLAVAAAAAAAAPAAPAAPDDDSTSPSSLNCKGLLNLQTRAQFLHSLLLPRPTPAAMTATGMAGTVFHTHRQQPYPVAFMTRALGLVEATSAAPVEGGGSRSSSDINGMQTACHSIAKCWSLLPCDSTTKTQLFGSEDVAQGTATVLFATLFSFVALLGQSSTIATLMGGGTGVANHQSALRSLISRAATALLVSPLYAAYFGRLGHTFSTEDAAATARSVEASVSTFSRDVTRWQNDFKVTGATKRSDRFASLIETVMQQVLELVESGADDAEARAEAGGGTGAGAGAGTAPHTAGAAVAMPTDWFGCYCRWMDLTAIQHVLCMFESARVTSVSECVLAVERKLHLHEGSLVKPPYSSAAASATAASDTIDNIDAITTDDTAAAAAAAATATATESFESALQRAVQHILLALEPLCVLQQ